MKINNTKLPLISIITVSYNVVNTIEQTILSVVNQDFEDYEYIIIDGGSTDGTVEIIKKYQDKITYWLSEPDKGIYDAMNKGVRLAKGEWVNFMNAGDEFFIRNFNLFFDQMNHDKYDIIYGDVYIKKLDEFILNKARPLIELNYSLNFCHQSSFVRTRLLRENAFSLQYKICSDYDFFLKRFISGCSFYYEEYPVSVFEYGGVSSGISNRYLREKLSIILNSHIAIKDKIWFSFKFFKMLIPFNKKSVMNLLKS
ncbi:glycosyltransferase family 2 protein [Flavobacterium sp.]|uniref:glycosyltransferase family 2 protein n=1 Tax=Flavobacterium sp. TaxID=239 RepID=UPI002D053782|nr:glycosyltransferase family 2 protein [Flavobacterium sp.]HSD07321.1 glycosyltransferase family 2 protein [Flavobacterium sp.]